MKEMIDVFGKKYSLSTLKAHGTGYNQTIEDEAEKELDIYKMEFKASKNSIFGSEVDVKIIKPGGQYDYDEDMDFAGFARNLLAIMKIYERKRELYKKVLK